MNKNIIQIFLSFVLIFLFIAGNTDAQRRFGGQGGIRWYDDENFLLMENKWPIQTKTIYL